MHTITLVTLASLIAVAAFPAHATLADRKSDQPNAETAQLAPYSGQTVIRGVVRSEEADIGDAAPDPYSGQIVSRGEVRSESRS